MEQVGMGLYFLWASYRNLVLTHLKQAFPEKSQEWRIDICKKNFRHMGRLMAEIMQTSHINDKFFKKWFVIKPDNEAHKNVFRNGGIGVLGHLGNWEWHGVLGSRLAEKEVYTLVKRHTNFWSNQHLEKSRNRAGMELIYVDQNPIIAVKKLRKGYFVAFTSDQDARNNGEFFPYLGKLASTFLGPATVARNSNAPLYFIWNYRDEQKRLVFEYEEIERPDKVDPKHIEEWEREFTYNWTRKLERVIREHPENYLWAHNRWKTQPKNLEELLKFWKDFEAKRS